MLQKASELAKKFDVPLTSGQQATAMALVVTNHGLELHMHLAGHISQSTSILFIDFLHGKFGYRQTHNCTINQPLARAVGIKSGFRPSILDATAGMGGDAFVLASLGCTVTMSERSPIVAVLLQDALDRAMADPKTMHSIAGRLSLISGDTRQTLQRLTEPPYTIYMDPMYPHRQKSALNSKEMRMLRLIAGDDDDSPSLLEEALRSTGNRVVVKRPKGAPHIADRSPTHEIYMKNSRFDVYLRRHL